ncbi:MAG: hypothetical protein GTO18_01390 [Anaerolineales bacterium]|nr:hypothetical protein [Anaerolineales bacterium]
MLEEPFDDIEKMEGTILGEAQRRERRRNLLIIIAILIVVIGLITAVVLLVNYPATTETLRDVVIIFFALESIIIGITLVVLIIQVAKLTALLEYELKPMLESTNETIGTVRGTTEFLSERMVRPVMKANSTYAAVRRALSLFDFRRPKPK